MGQKNLMNKRGRLAAFFALPRLAALGFLAAILLGALVLMIPSVKSGAGNLSFIDALFTATSAVCVTGLSPISDIAVSFTAFGQVVILVLIQIGGLGFMTLTSSLLLVIGKRLTLRERVAYADYYTEGPMSELKSVVKNTMILTVAAEGIGAILLTAAFSRYYPFGRSVFYGVFHSVSAFCNAGFDIIPDGYSMERFFADPFVLLPLAFLVILGGLGFVVISELAKKRSFKRLRVESKIALGMSGALLIFGTVAFLFNEYTNEYTLGKMNFGLSLLNAFFHAAGMRTAGFSTVMMDSMRPFARSVSIFLMFVGASPGSTGGGIKTTTFFVLIIWIYSALRRKKHTLIDRKKVGYSTLSKAATILILALVVITVSQALLLIFEEGRFTYEQLLYEVVSAYSTVGYSLNVTEHLSVAGKLVIIFNMFIGRIGVYALLLSANKKGQNSKVDYEDLNIPM